MTLQASVEEGLWPLVEALFASHDVAGLAVGVVREEEVVARGFGVRDVRTGESVTPRLDSAAGVDQVPSRVGNERHAVTKLPVELA